MKPEICALCNQHHAADQSNGEWVMFADYQALEDHTDGQPPGYQFFCKAHAPYAKSFSTMPAQQAISLLKQNISLYSLDSPPLKRNKWLRFISKFYKRC
jgi:hypothetical protein